MRYSTNHDMASEESPIQSFNGEQGALSTFVMAVTLGGSPMIYSSQEIGYDQPLSFFRQNTADWDSNPSYTSAYKKIMDVYTSSNALRKGTLRTFNTGDAATFLRVSQDEELLIMVNPTNQAEEVKTPIEFARGNALNLLDTTSGILPSVITLEPYQYTIWKVK